MSIAKFLTAGMAMSALLSSGTLASASETPAILSSYLCELQPECETRIECLTNDRSECVEIETCNGDPFSLKIDVTDAWSEDGGQFVLLSSSDLPDRAPVKGQITSEEKGLRLLVAPLPKPDVSLWFATWFEENSIMLMERRSGGSAPYTGSCEVKE